MITILPQIFLLVILIVGVITNPTGGNNNDTNTSNPGDPIHDPGVDPDCEDEALESLASSSAAQLSFSKRLPFLCQITALRARVAPLDNETIAALQDFLNSEPRDLVVLNADQLLWFVTQGAQDCRLEGRTGSTSPARKKRFIDVNVDFPPQAFPLPELDFAAFFLRKRKEVRLMTPQEWSDFTAAVLATRNTFPGNGPTSEYDILAIFHNYENSPAAHGGPAFTPWHREYLLRYENALRSHYPNVAIPYYDSSLEEYLPNPAHAVIWSDVLLGNNQGAVTTGPFKNFASLNHPECTGVGATLTRDTSSNVNGLLSQAKFQDLFSKTTYNEFRGPLESYHGSVHLHIDGHMRKIACAPMDPAFYMHHAFIDLLWEEFRQDHQQSNPETDYPANPGGSHDPFDLMMPFEPLTNIEGLSNHYTNTIFTYEPRPSKGFCVRDSQCHSPYLWCDLTRCRCVSKVRPGGDCTGLPNRACHCRVNAAIFPPMCKNDKCQCGPTPNFVASPFTGK